MNFKRNNEEAKNKYNIFNCKIIFSVLDIIIGYSNSALLNPRKWDISPKNKNIEWSFIKVNMLDMSKKKIMYHKRFTF